MRLLTLVTGISSFLAAAGCALAHPHVWVTVETELLYGQRQEITGFQHKWTFDEFYTAFALQGLDKNNDGRYDRAELEPLAEVNITSLKEFGFFTFPKVGAALVERSEPKDYWLEHKDGVLTLHFTLPLAQPVAAAQVRNFNFSIYDPTFYVAFSLAADRPVRFSGAAPKDCSAKIAAPEPQPAETTRLSETFFNTLDANANFGTQFAQTVSIDCEAK